MSFATALDAECPSSGLRSRDVLSHVIGRSRSRSQHTRNLSSTVSTPLCKISSHLFYGGPDSAEARSPENATSAIILSFLYGAPQRQQVLKPIYLLSHSLSLPLPKTHLRPEGRLHLSGQPWSTIGMGNVRYVIKCISKIRRRWRKLWNI